ncbi:alpha-L-fucosidase [Pilibacter termitis]|uniref:alpha-L-fucosidase n=1 Tax=Pilibacter termitis TaxID=263852 RepID=A0A1T4QQT0_9ENTE|nr:alpha-L-fucosidase [Pilibacter termitis]SKA06044.1 alpha-L-fucosidase [Pilibacter termitis]
MDIQKATRITPSERQFAWQQLEFYGFLHFGMNTMTDSEWGEGRESPKTFHPTALDVDSWIETLKESEMRAVILTCKHHDGFCLWPSDYTDYSVKNSPLGNTQGDIVKLVSESCKKYGLKFGVYLSPWDRNAKSYGKGKEYDDYYINQLTELLTNYGEIFCVWLDGACGEGENGKVQEYDWERYYETVRRLQPNAVLNICGPDVRWCGNEAGSVRKAEWSVVPKRLTEAEIVSSLSQKEDDGKFSRIITSTDEDLGSRSQIADEEELVWYPCEVDTSIRIGWFYHSDEDRSVRTSTELFEIYKKAVGGNSSLLLNVPPTPEGKLHPNDVASLKGLGEKIRKLRENVVENFHVVASSGDFVKGSIWQAEKEDTLPTLEIFFENEEEICGVILQENIRDSQRIELFEIYGKVGESWKFLGSAETVGHKKIFEHEPVKTKEMNIIFRQSREYPTLASLNFMKTEEYANED